MPTQQEAFPLLLQHPNLARLPPLPPVPDGFRLRTWQDGDEEPVSLLMADAFQDPSMAVYDDQLKHFHALPGVAPEGCFVLETTAGRPVATAIGRIDPAFDRAGILHQVAVRRDYWRGGLGSLTVLRAMHYIAQQGRNTAFVGFEDLDALLFYLSLGFAPAIDAKEIRRVWERTTHSWETVQVWREYYQLLEQTYPAQRPLLERCPLPQANYTPPATSSEAFLWHSDFIVDADGDLVTVRATIDERAQGVRFANQIMAPTVFVETLQNYPLHRSRPIFLLIEGEKPSPHGENVRALLWSAGYARAGLVGPRHS
ncbi:MAG: GNAT family N-acetyltransferase [Candidatus Latescibacteria bacterium]|nr:GNAT family N-acetyltransferase [Candidatus Latescibacterota bacterium]